MTKLLSISAAPGAPVACDMTAARDTPAERLAEYRRLFDHALVDHEATASGTTYRLADRPGVREWVLDLTGREAACCPFLSIEVHSEAGHLVWCIEGLGDADMAPLGDLLKTADRSDPSADLAGVDDLVVRGGGHSLALTHHCQDPTALARVLCPYPFRAPSGSGRRQGDQ
jgi:hypothetical protein